MIGTALLQKVLALDLDGHGIFPAPDAKRGW
jgi:hypothetical protein